MATNLRRPRPAVALLAAAALTAAPAAHAQEASDSTMVILLRTGPKLPKSVVESTLNSGLKFLSREMTPGKDGALDVIVAGKPEVKQITAIQYGFYNNVINATADSTPLTVAKNGDLELRQLLAADPAWQLKLLAPDPAVLTKLKVSYGKEVKEYDPAKDAAVLALTQAGTYTFRLPADTVPTAYEAEFETLKGEKKVIKGDWPKSDNFFLIRLRGYKGNRDALVKTLRDRDKVGNALDDLKIGKDVVLAIGEAQATDNEPADEELRDKNKLFVSVPRLRRGTQRRAWMLFPLTAEQATAELAKFEGKGPDDVIKFIQESKPALAADQVLIKDGSPPRWMELPPTDGAAEGLRPNAFGRVLTLVAEEKERVTPEDYKKLLDKYPAAKRLLVYEFDKTPTALMYKPNADKDPALVNETELGAWSVLLNKAAGKAATPKP